MFSKKLSQSEYLSLFTSLDLAACFFKREEGYVICKHTFSTNVVMHSQILLSLLADCNVGIVTVYYYCLVQICSGTAFHFIISCFRRIYLLCIKNDIVQCTFMRCRSTHHDDPDGKCSDLISIITEVELRNIPDDFLVVIM